MDRNCHTNGRSGLLPMVVPHTGDVDRNATPTTTAASCRRSSPIRGTWIEIMIIVMSIIRIGSSPIRGTWIEIRLPCCTWAARTVVPHTGDVDRNCVPNRFSQSDFVVPHTGDVDRNTNKMGVAHGKLASSPIRGTWIEIVNIDFSALCCVCRPPYGGRG